MPGTGHVPTRFGFTLPGDERGDRSRPPADRRGGSGDPRRGRQRGRRLPRRRVRLLGRGEPAHRPGGRGVPARPSGARSERPPARLLRVRARPGIEAAAGTAHGVDRDRFRRDVTGGLSHRGRLLRRSRSRRRAGGCARAIRLPPLEPAARACDRLGPQGRGADPAAGVPARDSRPHPASRSRGPRGLRGARPTEGRRARRHGRPRLDARGARGRRRTSAVPRRARPRAGALPGRKRWPDHARGSRRVPGDLAAADPRAVRGPRVRVQPASVLGRDPDRLRALAPRPASCRRRPGNRVGDRVARRRHARAATGPRRKLRVRPPSGRARSEALLGPQPSRCAPADGGARAGSLGDPAAPPERRRSRSSTSVATRRR